MGEIVGRAGGTAGVGELLRQSVDEGRERREQRSDFEARQPRASNTLLSPCGETRRIVDGQCAVALRSRESKSSIAGKSIQGAFVNNDINARSAFRLWHSSVFARPAIQRVSAFLTTIPSTSWIDHRGDSDFLRLRALRAARFYRNMDRPNRLAAFPRAPYADHPFLGKARARVYANLLRQRRLA